MEQVRKLFYLLLILPLLFLNTACSDDDDDDPVTPEPTVNKAEVLATALEAANILESFPAMMKATDLNTAILTGADVYVIDIRAAADYADGHIKDAVNVPAGQVLEHYKANNLETKETVVIACYSGQTAGWVNGILRMAGYTNTKDLKWGMCSWNSATDASWTGANVNNTRASQFVKTATAKPAAGELPVLSTTATDAQGILAERLAAVSAEGFGAAKVSSDEVYNNLSGYFILNYWKQTDYDWGHIEGAVQYSPPADLKLATALKTLPTDKPIAVYCYTGQTSAHVAAYLRALGYDAKSLLFGVNGMSYDTMPGTKWNVDQVHDYPLFK